MLREKFGSTDSEVTLTKSIHKQACAELVKYRAELQTELDHKPLQVVQRIQICLPYTMYVGTQYSLHSQSIN